MKQPKRLEFSIPAFQRISWASKQAQSTWEPRLQMIREACEYSPLALVATGRLQSATIRVRPFRVFSFKRRARDFDLRVGVHGEESPDAYRFLDRMCDRADSSLLILISDQSRYERACSSLSNNENVATTAGWPQCCYSFHSAERIMEWSDRTTLVASNREQHQAADTAAIPDRCWANNFLMHRLGLWPLAHLPCSFDCSETAALLTDALKFMHENQMNDVAELLLELLHWPLEYSVLHGIAELKTPVLKMVADTDATAEKHSVQFLGSVYPACAPNGVQFPYRLPTKLRISDAQSYQRGLANAKDS